MTTAELDGHGDRPGLLDRLVAGDRPSPTAGDPPQFEMSWLTRAGFPAARHMPDAALFLEAHAALVSQRAGHEGRDATRLLTTMRVLATLESQAVPDQRIWDSADINKATWKAYDDLLERTHLTASSPPFESNRLKRLTTYPKRFLADSALALLLAGLDSARLATDPTLAGPYVESFVMQQLRPQVDRAGGLLSHLRTGAGEREIDAVIEVGLDVYALEVKHATTPSAADARHLEWLRDNLGDRFVAGIVVHTGGDTYGLGNKLWAVHVHRLGT